MGGGDPYDHANASQSTNDTYPAMALALMAQAGPALESLRGQYEVFLVQAQRWGHLQRLGRTCLQDAAPLTVAQTHRADAAGVDRVRAGLLAKVAADLR